MIVRAIKKTIGLRSRPARARIKSPKFIFELLDAHQILSPDPPLTLAVQALPNQSSERIPAHGLSEVMTKTGTLAHRLVWFHSNHNVEATAAGVTAQVHNHLTTRDPLSYHAAVTAGLHLISPQIIVGYNCSCQGKISCRRRDAVMLPTTRLTKPPLKAKASKVNRPQHFHELLKVFIVPTNCTHASSF
jgi:hypothetical protein